MRMLLRWRCCYVASIVVVYRRGWGGGGCIDVMWRAWRMLLQWGCCFVEDVVTLQASLLFTEGGVGGCDDVMWRAWRMLLQWGCCFVEDVVTLQVSLLCTEGVVWWCHVACVEDVATMRMLLRWRSCYVASIVVYRRGVGGCINVMWRAWRMLLQWGCCFVEDVVTFTNQVLTLSSTHCDCTVRRPMVLSLQATASKSLCEREDEKGVMFISSMVRQWIMTFSSCQQNDQTCMKPQFQWLECCTHVWPSMEDANLSCFCADKRQVYLIRPDIETLADRTLSGKSIKHCKAQCKITIFHIHTTKMQLASGEPPAFTLYIYVNVFIYVYIYIYSFVYMHVSICIYNHNWNMIGNSYIFITNTHVWYMNTRIYIYTRRFGFVRFI